MVKILIDITQRSVRARNIGLSIYLLLGLSSCAVAPLTDSAVEPRRLGRDFQVYHGSPESTATDDATPRFSEPTGVLTVRSALTAALLNNPGLAAVSWEVRAREARALQAGLFSNPEFGLEVEGFGGGGGRTAFDGAENTLLFRQRLELGDKRAKRQRVATLERDLAAWDYETRRLDVFTAVAKAFVAALTAQERVTLAEEQVQLAKEAIETVAQQVKAGAASPVEETRARVTLAGSQAELMQSKREQTATQFALAATWGSTTVTFSAVTGDLETITEPPSIDELFPHLSHSPDIARWTGEKAQRQAALTLEEARQIPSVEVSAGVRYFNEDNTAALVFETSLPLPLFDRNQGNIQEAHARLAKVNAEQRAAEVQSRAMLAAAYQSLLAAYEQAETLRGRALPAAEAAYTDTRDGYRKGLFNYLDVLDAQRTLFMLRARKLDVLLAYHLALADIERLTATPLINGTPAEEQR